MNIYPKSFTVALVYSAVIWSICFLLQISTNCLVFLNSLNEWCLVCRFDLNAGNCKVISFRQNVWAVQIDSRIGVSVLGRVEEIKDLGVLLGSKMTFLSHIEAVVYKSSISVSTRVSTNLRAIILIAAKNSINRGLADCIVCDPQEKI
jgi:hypothetical protein